MPKHHGPDEGASPPSGASVSDTLSTDTADPWAVFLGTTAPTQANVAATLQFLASPSGLGDLTTLAEEDPTTWELGMTRLTVYMKRRAKALRDIVQERLDARREKAAVPRTLDEDLGELAPEGLAGVVVPFGYRLDRNGTWKDGANRACRVAGAPVVILGEESDGATGARFVRLGWLGTDGEWSSVRAGRAHTSDPNGVVRYAGSGAPWNALESKEVVRYLTAFERANMHTLPHTEITSRMGWHTRGGVSGFVLPSMVHGIPGLTLTPDEGMKAHVGGWGTRGNWEGWRAVLPYLKDYPLAMLGIYASLAAPLIWVLHASPFVVDWSGVTSGGKSTTLRLAASVWGSPLEGDGVFHSWGDTAVHTELYTGLVHSLPVILDDTKSFRGGQHAGRPGDFVYLFTQGRGRGRGLKAGGVSPAATWRTILLSSGEAPLAGYGRDAGVYARTVHVRGRPFGDDEVYGNTVSKWVNGTLTQHHGHAGERWVKWLVANESRWPSLVERWRVLDAETAASAPGRVAGRLAGYLALLALTEELAAEVLDIPDNNALDHVTAAVYAKAQSEDIPMEMYEIALNWAAAHVGRFWPRADAPPSAGWAGRWEAGSSWVWVMPTLLERVLADAGARLEEVEEAWASRGLVHGAGTTRNRSTVDVAGVDAVCIGLRVDARAASTEEK